MAVFFRTFFTFFSVNLEMLLKWSRHCWFSSFLTELQLLLNRTFERSRFSSGGKIIKFTFCYFSENFKEVIIKRLNLAALALVGVHWTPLFVASPVFAGNYKGLCSGTDCYVSVTPEAISSPYGSIPTGRVTSWGGGGESSTSVGTGVATTIFLGPIG